MLAKAVELAEAHGWFLCRQFENEANADVHTRTTAQEILADFAGERLDYWVTGFGTGGTLKGVARALKQASPVTRVVAAEPDNSPVLGSGIPQPRDADGKPSGSHPRFRPHLDAGLVAGLHLEADRRRRGRGPRRRDRARRGHRRAAARARARAARRHLRRHVERRDARGRADDRAPLEARHEHRLHAARHRRALPFDAAVRGHRRGDDGRGARAVALDAVVPLRRAAARAGRGGDRARPRRAAAGRARSRGRAIRRRTSCATSPSCCSRSSGASSAGPCASCSRGSASRIAASTSIPSRTRPTIAAARSAPCSRARTGAKTIPQIFIGGTHVGGATDLFDAWRSGTARELLGEARRDVRRAPPSSIRTRCCRSGCSRARAPERSERSR